MSSATLIIFPHAGGSPSYYAPLARNFSPDVRPIAVPYPDRPGANGVASLESIERVVDWLWGKLSPGRLDPSDRIGFFGHSMGALVAFEMARRFAQAGRPIDLLLVSACAAPGHSPFGDVQDSDGALLTAAASITGVDPQMLTHGEFGARILPTLRGFRAITQYRVADEVALNCPIRAFVGSNDEIALVDNMRHWEDRTSTDFSLRIFAGHHFYLSDHLVALAADIEENLRDGGCRIV